MDGRSTALTGAARIIVVSAWVGLLLGIAGSLPAGENGPGLVVAAAVSSGILVTFLTLYPNRRLVDRTLLLEFVIIGGALLTVTSATLTGTLASPYLLMTLVPTLLASIAGGMRIGLTTSLLSAGLLVGSTIIADGWPALRSDLGTVALFPLLALVVAQIRNLLVEVERHAGELEEASVLAEAELTRLGQANDLLRRLTDLYAEGSSNPVEVGRSAIEAIVDSLPSSFATATLFDTKGPVVVARAGTDSPDLVRNQFPLGDGNSTSGVVSIGTQDELKDDERSEIDRLLRPVAVSFSNAVLLQEIAGAAVGEERLRLARELHDEVGPALAALGFSLDSAAIEAGETPLGEELMDVRTALGTVIDDLRGIIADLRSDESGSLTSALLSSIAGLEGPPDLKVDLHELRPPRSAAGRHILAMLVEAVRNAYRHADATLITVTGLVDRHEVEAEVKDDGKGFDPAVLPDGHYGVMGMRERADRIGATMDIRSSESGTTVTIVWKGRQ